MTIINLDGLKYLRTKAGEICPLLFLSIFTNNIQGYIMSIIGLIVKKGMKTNTQQYQ